jgi:hypothetical protein
VIAPARAEAKQGRSSTEGRPNARRIVVRPGADRSTSAMECDDGGSS